MKTEILFILDRSGSMASCAADAVGGFNQFLKDQKKEPKGKRLTLLQFDDRMETTYESAKLKDCKKLVNGETYQPRGMTALLDAIGTGLDRIGKAKKAIVAIYTDGYENASHEWTADSVKALIAKAEKKGWEVLFLAADVDTSFARQTLGMASNRVAGGVVAMAASMDALSTRTTNYAETGVASEKSIQDDYDDAASKSA